MLTQVYATVNYAVYSSGSVRISLEDLILLLVLVGYGTYWGYELRTGAVLSRWGLRLHILLYVFLGIWLWFAPILAWAAPNYAPNSTASAEFGVAILGWFVIPFVAAYAGHSIGMAQGLNRVKVRRLAERIWMVQGRAPVWAWWLFIWLVRWSLEDFLLKGYSVFLPFQAAPNVSPTVYIVVVLLVAILYLFSFGLMIGFSRAVLRLLKSQRRVPPLSEIVLPNPSE